jgi:E3 ubiquitin-protein ligase HUWE1
LVPKKVNQHKESANLLDIVGIASLLRLVFLPQAGEMVSLEKLLCNLCENSRSRSDILSLLLAVLINEPNNLSGVEKTFASVIGRPQFGSETSLVSSDQFPHLVSQRCLEILAHLSSEVPSIAKYFLTESELLIAPKTPKAGKKNKGKDKLVPNPQVYPIVTLLNLLEKELYLNNQSVLEELILLLAQLLRPLAHVAKKKFSGSESSTDQTPGKEKHDIKLPSIPASCVRAVVLALKDSVSTGKTFQSTLSVLQHLCAYPDNLEIVASELLNSSKELCTVNKANVQALFQQLLSMKKDETIDAEVLTSFTSPTASQAKLLRILKAIDYLFSKNHGNFIII